MFDGNMYNIITQFLQFWNICTTFSQICLKVIQYCVNNGCNISHLFQKFTYFQYIDKILYHTDQIFEQSFAIFGYSLLQHISMGY